MVQPISGLTPPEVEEVTVMTVFPSMGATPFGRFIGRLCGVQWGIGKFFTLGKLFALLLIPVALIYFFWRLSPWACRRYRLTNRRLIVHRWLGSQELRSIPLDGFDQIDVEVLPGQEWFPCGNLIFRKGPILVFELEGVREPDVVQHAILKAARSYQAVQKVRQQQKAAPAAV